MWRSSLDSLLYAVQNPIVIFAKILSMIPLLALLRKYIVLSWSRSTKFDVLLGFIIYHKTFLIAASNSSFNVVYSQIISPLGLSSSIKVFFVLLKQYQEILESPKNT